MLYIENGQFKTSYRSDQQVFPIAQDRVAMGLLLAAAFIAVPLLADEYMFRAILIPFVILSMAALGVNILVGYCGQISLGSGAFMAVGAYMAYNTFVRVEGMPLILALISGGFFAMLGPQVTFDCNCFHKKINYLIPSRRNIIATPGFGRAKVIKIS
jgi:branched-chain amino acid transport system permease protein